MTERESLELERWKGEILDSLKAVLSEVERLRGLCVSAADVLLITKYDQATLERKQQLIQELREAGQGKNFSFSKKKVSIES